MKIVLPVQDTFSIYKHNPHTAPKFAIYVVEELRGTVHFSLHSIIENQMYTFKKS